MFQIVPKLKYLNLLQVYLRLCTHLLCPLPWPNFLKSQKISIFGTELLRTASLCPTDI